MRRVVLAGICVAALGAGVVRAQTTPPRVDVAATQAERGGRQYWIGVAVENIPQMIGKLMKLEAGQGLLVLKVLPGSPAEKVKLQAGDLLVTVNDRPLVSQQQLVAVANAGEEKAGGEGGWKVKTARVGLIRDGERMSVEVTPEARPAEMLVTGVGVRGSATQPDMIVLPNGGTLQVGPGYVVDLNAEAGGSGGLSVSSIRQVLSKGQTIVLSQESDGFGNVRNSVTVGGKTYDADPAGLAAMPAEVRELVDPLLKQAPRVVKIGPRTATELNLEQQVKEQERKIEELTRKLEAIQGKLDEKK